MNGDAETNGTGIPPALRDEICRLAEQDNTILAVHLFGSRARGDFRPDSDVDVALGMSGATEGERLANWIYFDKAPWNALGVPFGLKIDLDYYEAGSGGIVAPAVESHGVNLYERPLQE